MVEKEKKQCLGCERTATRIFCSHHCAMKNRWKNKEQREKLIEGLKKSRINAAVWHKSKEGRDWHKKNWKKTIGTRINKGLIDYKAIALKHSGSKSGTWKGGKSFEPYTPEFNCLLKEKIRQKYAFRCQQCFRHQDELRTKKNKKYKLIIHHIDYNKNNCSENNLIPLCRPCHSQTNYSREDWAKYFSEKVMLGD